MIRASLVIDGELVPVTSIVEPAKSPRLVLNIMMIIKGKHHCRIGLHEEYGENELPNE